MIKRCVVQNESQAKASSYLTPAVSAAASVLEIAMQASQGAGTMAQPSQEGMMQATAEPGANLSTPTQPQQTVRQVSVTR
eukprot:6180833-Pleurochrysis_carterae.AAC.3